MDGDMLSMAFQMVKEYGLEETLKIFLNILPENPSLIAVQKGFRNVVHGDHLIYKTAMGWNIHFYVVDNLGDGSLRVCGCFLEGNDNLFIEEELIFKPGQAQEIKIGERILHEAGLMQKLKKKRYEQTLSFYNEDCHINEFKKRESGYDFLHNNSEHFVNFVKTGEPKCQITMEIENFIKDHIFVQAIRNCSQMVKVITINGNWASIIKALCEAILNNSGVKSAIQEAIKDILKEVVKVNSNQINGNMNASMVMERGKSIADQAEMRAAKEAVKEEERVTTIDATKSKAAAAGVTKRAAKEVVKKGGKAMPTKIATKRVVRVGGKTTTVLATRSMSSRLMKERQKATTLQTANSTTKATVRLGGKATPVQATKGEPKRVVKEAGKTSILQATKSPTKPVVKAGGKAAAFHTTKSATKENTKVGGKTTRLQATKGTSAKQHLKEAKMATTEKATTVQGKESMVKKRVVKGEGTATCTTAQATKYATKEDVKETGKAITIQPTPNLAEGAVKDELASTVQTATSSGEEITEEPENATPVQANSTLKEEGEEIAIQSPGDEIVNEGKRATAVQATKSAATVAMQEASKHAIKHGAHQTTMQVAKNAAANAMKHTLNATVIAGLVVEGTFYTVNMGKAMYKHSQGEMNDEEFTDFAVEQTATSGGSAAGGISGSLAGVAAGAAVGSIVPGIGTVIGGTIGGFLGGVSGGFGGTFLGKEFGKLINNERKKEDNIDQMSDKPKFE